MAQWLKKQPSNNRTIEQFLIMNSLSNNNKPKQQLKGSFFEQLKDLGTGTVKTAVSEAGKIGGGVVKGLSGASFPSISPWENQAGRQPLTPERFPWQKEISIPPKPREIQVFSFLERQENISREQKINQLVEEIRKEILLLEKKQKIILVEAAKVTVETLPQKPGIYHLRFFEWLLKLLRDLRKKVSESATWLSVLNTKRKQRGYWKMYKKHGTTFGLSGERSLATQAG